MSWGAAGAGAAEGLDTYLQRMIEQAKLAAVSKGQDETARHNMATEGILSREHDLKAEEQANALKERTQAHTDTRNDKLQDNGRALGDAIPAGTALNAGNDVERNHGNPDPAVNQMMQGGVGSLLKMRQASPAVPENIVAPGDNGEEQPRSYIKLKSAKQQHEDDATDRATAADEERSRHNLEMEGKQPKESDPQPTIMYGNDGKPHAIQFKGGASHEIPLDPNLTGKRDPNDPKTTQMRQNGHNAVTRLDTDIEKADQMGLIGPASGRIYNQFAKFGTTGDAAKDEMIGRLKSDILLTKMHVDAGIGGTRAAASPLLLKNWEDIAMKSSKDLLHGYTSAIRDDMGPITGAAPAATAGGKSAIHYDMKGNVIQPKP